MCKTLFKNAILSEYQKTAILVEPVTVPALARAARYSRLS
jgi:hypothetical protein